MHVHVRPADPCTCIACTQLPSELLGVAAAPMPEDVDGLKRMVEEPPRSSTHPVHVHPSTRILSCA